MDWGSAQRCRGKPGLNSDSPGLHKGKNTRHINKQPSVANVTAEKFLLRIELKCSRQPNYTVRCSNHMLENIKTAGKA